MAEAIDAPSGSFGVREAPTVRPPFPAAFRRSSAGPLTATYASSSRIAEYASSSEWMSVISVASVGTSRRSYSREMIHPFS